MGNESPGKKESEEISDAPDKDIGCIKHPLPEEAPTTCSVISTSLYQLAKDR
jgi:hypothetical protein